MSGHVDTFRRVLRRVDSAAVDTAIGLFLAERAGVGGLHGASITDDEQRGSAQLDDHHNDDEPPIAGALAVDGEAQRGARQADGRAVHLLSAMLHQVQRGGAGIAAQTAS